MNSKKLTIFEGPDGSGKTTAALNYAKQTGAKYVHFGPLPNISTGLGRMYVEAMMPALLGYQDVVFDRCWLSEEPYGIVFRAGKDRLGNASRRMLERLALRCGGIVIYCLPTLETVCTNFLARKGDEYLDNETQLKYVYRLYSSQTTQLRAMDYNYLADNAYSDKITPEALEFLRPACHSLDLATAGNLDADVILVGDCFAGHKNQDPWYQWPFASFSQEGCSQWLTNQLDQALIGERDLMWVNSDQDLNSLRGIKQLVIGLGDNAHKVLRELGIDHTKCEHPQAWKRFHSKERYPLIDLILNR